MLNHSLSDRPQSLKLVCKIQGGSSLLDRGAGVIGLINQSPGLTVALGLITDLADMLPNRNEKQNGTPHLSLAGGMAEMVLTPSADGGDGAEIEWTAGIDLNFDAERIMHAIELAANDAFGGARSILDRMAVKLSEAQHRIDNIGLSLYSSQDGRPLCSRVYEFVAPEPKRVSLDELFMSVFEAKI